MPAAQTLGLKPPSFLRGVSANSRVNSAAFRPGTIAPIRTNLPSAKDENTEEAIAARIAAATAIEVKKLSAQFSERTSAAVELLRTTAERLAAEARTDALEIGFLVARRILEMEISQSTEPLVSLVKSAVRRLGESRRIVVHLCPDDAQALNGILQNHGSQTLTSTPIAQIEIVADAALKRGDCLVEGDQVTVDGRLDARLEELHRLLASGSFEDST